MMTKEELAEEERDLQARMPEIERRLRENNVSKQDIFELLDELEAEKKRKGII